jgi:hypothetical protein
MKRGIVVGVCLLLLIIGVINWRTKNYGDAQAAIDRQTVDCLAKQLTQDEKERIAQFTAAHDREAIRVAYTGIFQRCVVRRDQWARSDLLILSARQVLKYDPEFKRMLEAGSVIGAQR